MITTTTTGTGSRHETVTRFLTALAGPRRAGPVAGRLDSLEDLRAVPAALGHVVLDGPDLAAAVSEWFGSSALEGVDRARRLRAGLGDGQGDAALAGEWRR
jgi:hypothetical protein